MIDPLSLLGALGSTVRLGGSSKPEQSIETLGFDELLSKARSGKIDPSLPVSVDPALGVEFSQDQLTKLAAAVDKAQASGAERAAVLIDGDAFELDVAKRQIIGRLKDAAGGLSVGIDALIQIDGSARGEARDAQPLPFRAPGLGIANPSLIDALRPAS
ncbi:MAG: hypothetical protein AAGI17_07665 [Planctomycetota bacterium]